MKYIHDDREFPDLVRIVGAEHRPAIAPSLVEKDYWVTHTLWSVQQSGLECWFKGGTSLSKGFGLIHRFSEDLDLELGAGTAVGVPTVTNWKGESAALVRARQMFFGAVEKVLVVPGACVELFETDKRWTSAELRVKFTSVAGEAIPTPMKPFVVIEAGSARVVPSVPRDLSSFVHDWLAARGQPDEFADNRPRAVACTHPIVTLIEKLDAITRHFPNPEKDPGAFVRHYEDAARVIASVEALPALGVEVAALCAEMTAAREIKGLPAASHVAFEPQRSDRWAQVERAYRATDTLFFGPRFTLADACERIRGWLAAAPRH